MVGEGKAPWETPELVVLVRSRPEEAVLSFCKNPGYAGGGPTKSNCKLTANEGCEVLSTS